ncbi:hypothetical protein SAMN02745121_02853 [Nannocystis exedens]|uniref:Uncharacterized protein n=1 Tax=Nannocystis exedens TaxID=54 RepID=A0A1I1XGT1_9BACT|nr:hypothetical protein [Nannocystis exedens]PCC73418.1 hypothetical protein NAEX_06506 [Nannocystis exedens]SFE06557.1 hypothetical protein SAMN02745121_02853 [Nannocystis exedens]
MIDRLRLRPHALTRALVPCLLLSACPGEEGLLTDYDPSTTSTTTENATGDASNSGDGPSTADAETETATTGETTDLGTTTATTGDTVDPLPETVTSFTGGEESDTDGTDGDTGVGPGESDCTEESGPFGADLSSIYLDELQGAGTYDCAVVSADNATPTHLYLEFDCQGANAFFNINGLPDDFKTDFDGVTEISLDLEVDGFEGDYGLTVRDKADGALVLGVFAADDSGVVEPDFTPLSYDWVASCGNSCETFSTVKFAHEEGASIELYPGQRGLVTGGGRDYDIVLITAYTNLCEDHSDYHAWVIGAAPAG